MMKRCLDEGVLQAYVDGELSQELTGEAAAHMAACESCAASLAAMQSESAFFAAAFAPDDSVSVPTEALRARIGAAVAQLESAPEAGRANARGWRLGGFLASLSLPFTFTPQSAAAFASLLAVAAALIYFAVNRQPNKPVGSNQGEVARSVKPATPSAPNKVETNSNGTGEVPNISGGGVQPGKSAVVPTSYRRRRVGGGVNVKPPVEKPKAPEILPGEKDYQTAIASLEKAISLGGDAALKPALRVEYERNLAILDSAISQTRQVAARDPKDKEAVGFLMSTYQSKVELLSKVADQTQVAALGR